MLSTRVPMWTRRVLDLCEQLSICHRELFEIKVKLLEKQFNL